MSAVDVVAFDADDTLWHCESLFQATQMRHDTTPDHPRFHRLDRIADLPALIDGL